MRLVILEIYLRIYDIGIYFKIIIYQRSYVRLEENIISKQEVTWDDSKNYK